MLKPLALLGRVGGGPAGAGAERVQVLVHGEVAQRVGGAVYVRDAHVAGEHARRLVERRGDLISDLLLPVRGCVAGAEYKEERDHGGGEATAGPVRWGGGRWTPACHRLRPGRCVPLAGRPGDPSPPLSQDWRSVVRPRG